MNWKLVTTREEFLEIIKGWEGPISADAETAHDRFLLGISLSPFVSRNGIDAIYLVCCHWQKEDRFFKDYMNVDFYYELAEYLSTEELVGHNTPYDRHWLNEVIGANTKWIADTRIMWHLSDNPEGSKGYGLKDAQVELLGWSEDNEKALGKCVRSHGGDLKNGDHYLADLDVLAEYACFDAFSTISVFRKLVPFFDKHDYWWMLDRMMEYNLLLDYNTRNGVAVNLTKLKQVNERLGQKRDAAKARFLRILNPEIKELENDWKEEHLSGLKRKSSIELYRNSPHRWRKFNLNSSLHKRDLFYGKLRLPILETTPTGASATNQEAIETAIQTVPEAINSPILKTYLTYAKTNYLVNSFTGPYIDSVVDNRIHPGLNICGTVSYRLSGFKPYLLNAPFEEKAVMSCLRVDDGFVGVHADLSAIEPTVTAHFTEDVSLLRVFRDGLGDIYLDLALYLFPNDKELQSGYNPSIPVTEEVKKRFSRQRKIAKVIQLAVQYTGTGHTVSRNLTKQGIPTTVEEANIYVRAYWNKFAKVAEFNRRLAEQHRKHGLVRNVVGRIIQMPWEDHKDLGNRMFQSSGHDVLVEWVLVIYRMARERGIPITPVVLDIHDSTSNQTPVEYKTGLQKIYKDALQEVNDKLQLAVTIKMEMKEFKTLAGLKADE
jgi:DNA polymerase I-like protein with 3'-5' exonuclease and polymerase domains